MKTTRSHRALRAIDNLQRKEAEMAGTEKCASCGSPATTWTTGRTFTFERPKEGYLVHLCQPCLEKEQAAWEAWCDRQSDPGLN
jgi:hypothetical protein